MFLLINQNFKIPDGFRGSPGELVPCNDAFVDPWHLFTQHVRLRVVTAVASNCKDEVLPFHGINSSDGISMKAGNSWANVNEKGSWNRPHMHNGCWYSGVLYLQADGDEGNFEAIDKDAKVVHNFPHHQRVRTSFALRPKTGDIHLFPSGLMHMVEPNYTDKERYSISFNMEMEDTMSQGEGAFGQDFSAEDYDHDEFLFNLDERGNPIR